MIQAKASATVQINVSADQAWEVVGAGGGVDKWFSAVIATCRVDGDKRYCTTQDGHSLEEDIINVDHEGMVFSYGIPKVSMLPVQNILAQVSVKKEGEDSSLVEWSGTFEVEKENEEEARNTLEHLWGMGIKGIEEYLLTAK